MVDLLPHAALADGEGVESSWRVAVTDQLPATGFDVGEVERRNRNLTRLGDAVELAKTHNMVLDTTAPAGASSPLATAADIAGTGDRAHGHLRLYSARATSSGLTVFSCVAQSNTHRPWPANQSTQEYGRPGAVNLSRGRRQWRSSPQPSSPAG
ncbi:hypothetical protein [Micromonospora sp. NPDC049240]|uniref:hypothetical protein n=1 Tax=Micromonospora sp. NPDC049240 TaxID=3155151 RepID=UPI0033CDCC7D